MNKHFRVSGSNFTKLEECGVPVSAVLRRAGLPLEFFRNIFPCTPADWELSTLGAEEERRHQSGSYSMKRQILITVLVSAVLTIAKIGGQRSQAGMRLQA